MGGSDTHQYLQYGIILNDFETDCKTVDDLKKEIKKSNYKIQIADELPIKVKSARLVKKLIKSSLDEKGYAPMYHTI